MSGRAASAAAKRVHLPFDDASASAVTMLVHRFAVLGDRDAMLRFCVCRLGSRRMFIEPWVGIISSGALDESGDDDAA